MSVRRIGPFVIDEPECRFNQFLSDEGMTQLNIDDSDKSHSLMSSSDHGNEFSIWNNDQPRLFHHHSNGFHSHRQQSSFFGMDDSSKSFTNGFFGSKDTRDLPSPIGSIPSSATNQYGLAPQPPSFPIFTPRQYIPPAHHHSYNHHHQQQQMPPPPFNPSEAKLTPAFKVMTSEEFHLTRFGSFRLSVSPPDSLMVNNEDEEEEEDDEKASTK